VVVGDPEVQLAINARLLGRSRTAFTAADITKALDEMGFRRSQEDVATALDALVEEGKLKRRTHHVFWRYADEPAEPVTVDVYRAKA
jgi:3-hydroxyacyl-CoA dehydrogenase